MTMPRNNTNRPTTTNTTTPDTNTKGTASTIALILTLGIIGIIFLITTSKDGTIQGGIEQLQNKTNNTNNYTTQAQGLIDQLDTGTKQSTTPYDRTMFGKPWTDNNTADLNGQKQGNTTLPPTSNNGCDTQADILTRDLDNVTKRAGAQCTVASGTLTNDPYTGTTIEYIRGGNKSSVHIDHIVALEDAWRSGADTLSQQERINIANDPLNLIAVSGKENMAKGSKDASQWLVPNNEKFQCEYAARQVQVKVKYGLVASKAEKSALQERLARC